MISMSGEGGGSAGDRVGSGAGGVGGGSPRSRPGTPGGCRSRPRPSEASRAVPRSSARWISLGVPEPLPRSVAAAVVVGRRGSSGSGLGRGGLPGDGGGAQVRLSSYWPPGTPSVALKQGLDSAPHSIFPAAAPWLSTSLWIPELQSPRDDTRTYAL